jgi:hypothetical protein
LGDGSVERSALGFVEVVARIVDDDIELPPFGKAGQLALA